MRCNYSSKCKNLTVKKRECSGCSYKHIEKETVIKENDSPMARNAKNLIKKNSFEKCSKPKKNVSTRYAMDDARAHKPRVNF